MPSERDDLTSCPEQPAAAPWSLPVRRPPTTTPRLAASGADTTHAVPQVTVASLRLPAAVVDERRSALASRARVLGGHHSLRLWRDAHREALTELAREASGIPTGVECQALFWELADDLYHVSATFAPPRPTIH
jgi:hypothetical protein